MNNRYIKILVLISCSALAIAGCSSDNSALQSPSTTGTDANSGTISQKNFSVLTADLNPSVIDETANTLTQTSVEITAFIGDRNNQVLTDSHTINFAAEYGLIEPSCVTENGECSVTWTAIKFPEPGGPGDDGFATITAYASGEEGFTDTNGNNTFDDGDATFDDLEEPFIDSDESGGFTAGDQIIDVKSTNDPTGENLVHDIADGFFNGSGCTHSSLCGDRKITTVFARVSMNLIVNEILSRTIGGTVTGLDPSSTGVVLRLNNVEDLPINANGDYTFTAEVDDGQTYTVTVLTNPTLPTQTCSLANATGTVSANVTNVDVTCATNTFTIAGNISGIPSGETVTLQNNGGDDLLINADGAFIFTTPIADGAGYNVTILVDAATATCTPSGGTGSDTVSGSNITNVTIGCI
ncbi:Invasin domain protein [hydrothermal vent metagenome]|uniref:Invasin domain protein n=1 Tax=hydrothermal vent metagenome TaxID=652676 RepID=A0A3B0WWI7_9ZZZZ